MADREHMYGMCKKCGLTYDMDFEESPEDDHLAPSGQECYSEDWDVWVADCEGDCDAHSYLDNPRPSWKSRGIDLSAKPL